MMNDNENRKPECFGVLEEVFPKTGDGLRSSPESCMYSCKFKTECLRAAVSRGEGAGCVQTESVDRAYKSGNLSFIQRWSRKKHFSRRSTSDES